MKKYFALVNSELVIPVRTGIREVSYRHPVESLKKIVTHFVRDSLYRNSIYLMFSAAILAFFGFFFWIINARFYSPGQVGIATTLISVMGLIASFSNLGLNAGLVRFLPNSKYKNELINSSLLITTLTGLVLSLVFLAGLHIFSPKLLFIRDNPIYAFSFIIFVIALSNNTIVESLFAAYRSAKYTLAKNTILSITKLILPLLLISLSAFGIFAAVGFANILAILLSILILIRLFKFNIVFKQNFSEIKKIATYSFGNYIAGFLGALPAMALPIIITNNIGAAETGYFYIALMIANFIFVIPMATTTSLFAEGSHNESEMKNHIIKAVRITSLVLVPTIFVTALFGNYILNAFGKSYSEQAFQLLQLLIISSIPLSINNILGTVLKVRNKIKELLLLSGISAFIILFLTYLFLGLNIYGIGLAWLIGNTMIMFAFLYFVFRKNKP